MAHEELPEPLRKIRNKYPASVSDAKAWAKIEELVYTGDHAKIASAEELARAVTLRNPNIRLRHEAAITARTSRAKYLKIQRGDERAMAGMFSTAGDRMISAVNRVAGEDGAVSPGRMASLLDRLKELNGELYKGVSSAFTASLRTSVTMGLRSAMAQATRIQAVLHARRDKAKSAAEGTAILLPAGEVLLTEAADEDAADPLRAKVRYSQDSKIFKLLFTGALKTTMKAGLFGKTGVSNRVWDLRDENYLRLKRLVAGGIARGESAAKISRDIRSLLHQPATLRGEALDDSAPGRGVYRSAYKNAMRLTRTENNRAFVNADMAFAKEKGWKVMWVVSVGQREQDECDFLNGTIMTPEEFAEKYPVHPQCLCTSAIVLPESTEDEALAATEEI